MTPPAAAERRVGAGPLTGQLARFAGVGVASTVAYLALYQALRAPAGAFAANALAVLLTAVGNTAANRRLTFGVRGAAGRRRQYTEGLTIFAVGVVMTSAALALLGLIHPGRHRTAELAVLVLANLLATVLRFVLFRSWVFHPGRRHGSLDRWTDSRL